MKTTKLDYYGDVMTERRKQFNNIINRIDMVLMNNIPEVDASVWDNFEDKSPLPQECEMVDTADEKKLDQELAHYCLTHEEYTNNDFECEEYNSDDGEVYQWFAVNTNDADYLKRHNQYITYSDLLDTYFLAICHYGTSWDYVDSMVDDILDDRDEQGNIKQELYK